MFVKREDLIHPIVSGNKWHKLKYNLIAAQQQGYDTVLSFGGAYSNHIHALAGAGHALGLNTIGVIRGEAYEPLNATLQFAVDHHMVLHYLNRIDYRRKNTPEMIADLHAQWGAFYCIPEGGSNALAVKGCADIVADIDEPFDVIACACGTGGTLAGLVTGLTGNAHALGFAVLKGGDFLNQAVQQFVQEGAEASYDNWSVNLDYHFGGYAKSKPPLLAFIADFERRHGIPLEPVYTGKLMYGVFDLIEQGYFPAGSSIVVLHSGGLQGRTVTAG